jgi:hypothetical protein
VRCQSFYVSLRVFIWKFDVRAFVIPAYAMCTTVIAQRATMEACAAGQCSLLWIVLLLLSFAAMR